MSTQEVEGVMQSLEASWFEAQRAANVALNDIKRLESGDSPALLEEAISCFDAAQLLKRQIMREIESIEDASLEDALSA